MHFLSLTKNERKLSRDHYLDVLRKIFLKDLLLLPLFMCWFDGAKMKNDNLGEIIFRLWQAFDYIGLSEWQLSWTIFFRNLPWKVNFVMARFLWIVRVSIKLMHISMYICVVGGFHLFIVFTSTRTIRYSDSTLFFHLQSSATNQETPKYFAHNNCKSFSKEQTKRISLNW